MRTLAPGFCTRLLHQANARRLPRADLRPRENQRLNRPTPRLAGITGFRSLLPAAATDVRTRSRGGAILRVAALPGADRFIAATAKLGSNVGTTVARGLALVGLWPNTDVADVARGYAVAVDRDRRAAFLATLRGVIGPSGQRCSTPATATSPKPSVGWV